MKNNKNSSLSGVKRFLQIFFLARKYHLTKSLKKIRRNYEKELDTKKAFKEGKSLEEFGKNLRLFCEEAGPVFIKFGQLLSVQRHLLPKKVYSELEKLQDIVPEFHFDEVKKIIEEDIGLNMFSEISEKPAAAASLAQVHKAKLKSGEIVALKVRRPNIEKNIKKDISLLRFLCRHINFNKINMDKNFVEKIVDEVEEIIYTELNFIVEARNMNKISRLLNNGIKIPKANLELTTKRVLVMEWISSIKITDLDKIESLGLDKKKIISKVMETYFRQILVYGFYHADPHPANMGVTRKGDIVLYDFGAIGNLTRDHRISLIKMTQYIFNQDAENYLKEFLKANKIPEPEDKERIINEIENVLDKYATSIIPDYGTCAQALTEILIKHELRDNHKITEIIRTLTILSSIAKIYHFEDTDSMEIFKKIIGDLLNNNFKGIFSLENLEENAYLMNQNFKGFISNPKEFLEKNMPSLSFKKSERKNNENLAESKYRGFGLYKYPFLTLLIALGSIFLYKYYPELYFLNSPIFYYGLIVTGLVFLLSLLNLMYLDYRIDKRTEIYKYPFFTFLLIFIGIIIKLFFGGAKLFEYPVYVYVFLFSAVLLIYSLVHMGRVIKYKIAESIEKELPF